MRRPVEIIAVALLALPALAACASAPPAPELAASCTRDQLATLEPGTLTMATAAVTRSPWVEGADLEARTSGDPHGGQGYDAAVGYALAERLGFERDEVSWVPVSFPDALDAGEKPFDVHIGQATITAERREAVDLSAPYYVMRQAVVSLTGREVASATSLPDLDEAALVVVAGSPAEEQLAALGIDATAVPDLDAARSAVSGGSAQALVTDLVTAIDLDQEETRLVDGVLVGQLPRQEPDGEMFGMVLAKDSPLTECVDAALATLREDGTLDALEQRWLMKEPGYPELD